MARISLLFVAVLFAGCATSFQGDAMFPGGPRGCFDRCSAAGLTMQSYVFVGEYTTGCVCTLKDEPPRPTASADTGASAASAAAAVAVMTQMRAAQAAQNAGIAGAVAAH